MDGFLKLLTYRFACFVVKLSSPHDVFVHLLRKLTVVSGIKQQYYRPHSYPFLVRAGMLRMRISINTILLVGNDET